jgi:hypothetical protein
MIEDRERRLYLGFLVAPLIPIFINAVLVWPIAIPAALIGAAIGYPLTFMVGLPLVIVLRHYGKMRLRWLVVSAGLLTCIPDLLMSTIGIAAGGSATINQGGVSLSQDGRITMAGMIWFFAIRPLGYWLMGALGGWVFWLIAVRSRSGENSKGSERSTTIFSEQKP